MAKQKKTPFIQIPQTDTEIICRDFAVFCSYLVEHKIKLSKNTGHIGKKDCFEMNKLFFIKEDYEKATRFQTYYPMIHFFYYTALKHKILELNPAGTGMIYGKNHTLFQNASTMEQYTLLLLDFLYDPGFLKYGRTSFHIYYLFSWFNKERPKEGKIYQVHPQVFPGEYSPETKVTAHLEEFRLIRIEKKGLWEDEKEMSFWKIEVLPALRTVCHLYDTISAREEDLWEKNEIAKYYFDRYMDILEPAQKKHVLSEIFVPVSFEIPKQTIDLKVSMRYHDCSRTIRMNLSDSLYDLHMMIQYAFCFDNDHLFEFYVGRKPFEQSYTIEEAMSSGDEASAEMTALGELELRKGQSFTYLFDFGDCWWFEIKVEGIADGRAAKPLIIKSENEAPEQYPMWDDEEWFEDGEWDDYEDEDHENKDYEDEDYEEGFDEGDDDYESGKDADITVASILASIEDELIEDQYSVLCMSGESDTGECSTDEKRKRIEEIVCQEPDKMLAFLTEEMSDILARLIHNDTIAYDECCQLAKLYSFGFCMFPEKEECEILVPECICDIYGPKLEKKEKLPDQFTEISEILIKRSGVIEMEKLYFAVRSILKRRIDYEEYAFFIFSRLHYFGEYFINSFDGIDYISRYGMEITEKIIMERRKPENHKYKYPEFGKMKVKELREPLKELEGWTDYIRFHLSIDPESAFWLMEQIPLMISSGIIDVEEVINAYQNVVKNAGSRMTKKASEMIRELYNTLPLATRFGNSVSDGVTEEYEQLSLFD